MPIHPNQTNMLIEPQKMVISWDLSVIKVIKMVISPRNMSFEMKIYLYIHYTWIYSWCMLDKLVELSLPWLGFLIDTFEFARWVIEQQSTSTWLGGKQSPLDVGVLTHPGLKPSQTLVKKILGQTGWFHVKLPLNLSNRDLRKHPMDWSFSQWFQYVFGSLLGSFWIRLRTLQVQQWLKATDRPASRISNQTHGQQNPDSCVRASLEKGE